MVDYLKEYLRESYDFLFTTIKKGNQMKQCDIRKIVKIASKRANIGKIVFPHLFRHSLATNLLKRGANLILIKNQLGHVFIESTMIYVNSTPLRNKSEYDYYKPAYI